MKSRNVTFAIMMTLLTMSVSFLGETGFAQCVRDFIAYSPWVPIVRKISLGSGCAIVAIAIAYGTISKLCSTKVVVVMSDKTSLFFFIVMLTDVTLLGMNLHRSHVAISGNCNNPLPLFYLSRDVLSLYDQSIIDMFSILSFCFYCLEE